MSQVGEELTYTLVATNTGTVPLSDVRMTDELPGLTDLTCDRPCRQTSNQTTNFPVRRPGP